MSREQKRLVTAAIEAAWARDVKALRVVMLALMALDPSTELEG